MKLRKLRSERGGKGEKGVLGEVARSAEVIEYKVRDVAIRVSISAPILLGSNGS